MPAVRGRKRRELGDDATQDISGTPTQRRPTQDREDESGLFDSGHGATQDGSIQEMSKKLVRLALACEFQRRPIRRQEINEKVLGTSSRAFKMVFHQAQTSLRDVFGMKMQELPGRENITLQQRRAAQKKDSQSKLATSWILVSILPSGVRDPNILPPPMAPTSDEEARYTGIYTILVSLITLSGGTLPDAKMERYLKRLNIDDKTPIAEYERNDKLVKRLEKDGYTFRIKESTGTGEDDIYWVVGPRGKVEVGDDGVRGLAEAVYGDLPEKEAEELRDKIRRSLGISDRPNAERKDKTKQNQKKQKNRGQRSQAMQDESADEDG